MRTVIDFLGSCVEAGAIYGLALFALVAALVGQAWRYSVWRQMDRAC